MGCDIHFCVEKFSASSGEWERAEALVPNPYIFDNDDPKLIYENWYSTRNYNMFAILADVRNGHGFAGVRTGSGFNPICDPKGIPEDAATETQAASDAWNGDGHSHSWFAVNELLNYNWHQMTTHQVTMQDVNEKYPNGGAVEAFKKYWNYFQDYPQWMPWGVPIDPDDSYITFDVEAPYYKSAQGFFPVIMRMAKLAYDECKGDLNAVRCVFWFDN